MAMYDYRRDLAKLIQLSDGSPASLEKLSLVLRIISNLSLNSHSEETGQKLDELLSSIINNTAKDKNVLELHSEDDRKVKQINGQSQSQIDSYSREKQYPENTYRVVRLLIGAKLVDEHQNQVAYYNERAAHHFGWKTDDLVEIDASARYDQTSPRVIRTITQHSSTDDSAIGQFKYGIVEQDADGQLYVARSSNGQQLSDANPAVAIYAIADQLVEMMHLRQNDIIDLAWYTSQPSGIKIRWIYFDDAAETAKTDNTSAPKHLTASSKDADVHDHHESLQASADIDFDLKGQTVGIAVGDEIRTDEYQQLVDQHHGQLLMINAFTKHKNNSKYFDTSVQKCDIVILVQNYNKHNTSGNILTAVKDYSKKFAISNSAGIQSVERAIYRADKRLYAYEPANANINYPLINK